MATHLLDLPAELLSSALSRLSVNDLAQALSVCSQLAQLSETGQLWREVLARWCGLELADRDSARDALKLLLTTEPTAIRFVGLLTDGGIDSPYQTREGELLPDSITEREMQYWVSSLFQPTPWLLYCSASGRTDITCAATLDGYHDAALEAAEQTRREYMLERLSVIAAQEWNMPIDGFGGLSSASPEVLEEAFYAATEIDMGLLLHGINGTIEMGAHLLKIRRMRAQIEHRWRARRAGGPRLRLLEHGGRACIVDSEALAADSIAAATSSSVAVVRRLTVRRPTSCSCPASHGIVFGARERMSPEQVLEWGERLSSQLFLGEDGGWLGGPMRIEGLGAVVRRTRCAEGEVVEVEAPPQGPYGVAPIAAFSYRPLTELQEEADRAGGGEHRVVGPGGQLSSFAETGLMVAQLAKARCVRFLLVKLLRAEDRMALCNDDHSEMNIDMDYVGLDGHIINEGGSAGEAGPAAALAMAAALVNPV